jgi:hypothetical protein
MEIASSGPVGADLGLLDWWGCKINAREVRAKMLKPRPFNENHTHLIAFSSHPIHCIALVAGTLTSAKPRSGFTTACLECGFTT